MHIAPCVYHASYSLYPSPHSFPLRVYFLLHMCLYKWRFNTMQQFSKGLDLNTSFSIPLLSLLPFLYFPFHPMILFSILKIISSLYPFSIPYLSLSHITTSPGLDKEKLSEVHGNIFTEKCPSCGREFERGQPSESIGMKKTGNLCTARKIRNIRCR